jgi:hypothetical protein
MVNSNFEMSSATTFEYDHKINPLAASFTLNDILLNSKSSHNITKQVVSFGTAGEADQTLNYTYTYNNNNYPTQVSRKEVKPGTPDLTTITKFIYK